MNDYQDLADGMLAPAAAALLSAAANVSVLVYSLRGVLCLLGVVLVLTATFASGNIRSNAYQVLNRLRPNTIRIFRLLDIEWRGDPQAPSPPRLPALPAPPDPPGSPEDLLKPESPQG